jgi:hypothetical protein
MHMLKSKQLFGWHRDPRTGLMREVTSGPSGMWSPQLDSYLAPEGEYLRLYDRSGHMRLTEAEQETRRADGEAWQEARRARQADLRARQAELRAIEEAQRAKQALQQRQLLAEKLRSMCIDPDQLV